MKAAKPFAKGKNAQSLLEKSLRKTEAEKTKNDEKEVSEVSYDTLCTAIQTLTICSGEVITAIIRKFNELGYQTVEK
ncbi:TPA: hypothetical protein DCZ39_00285 [Patescibacteria group bacterium]|nr:hypothetical protein [Candidatus Gracilibacteria bacterium]